MLEITAIAKLTKTRRTDMSSLSILIECAVDPQEVLGPGLKSMRLRQVRTILN
jgi:hypothetical protein